MCRLAPYQLRTLIANIEKPAGIEGCWVWTGALNVSGYGSFGQQQVYRVLYEALVGPIPDGHELDHLCRNRACLNPHHLEPVSISENRRRAHAMGPWELRRYCRRGHALVNGNARLWSYGRGRVELRCYACHDGKSKDERHVD